MADASIQNRLPAFSLEIDRVHWDFSSDFGDDFDSDPVVEDDGDPDQPSGG